MFIIRLLKLKLFLLTFTAVAVISLANILIGYFLLPGPLVETQTIIIKPKLSTKDISKLLAKNNVIKHRKLFELISRIYSYYSPLKSGEYNFTNGITPYQVITKLASGKSIIHRLFIPEGYTVKEILERINSEERLVGKVTSNIPEGYLMPSTYFYTYGDQRENLIDIMRNNMSRTLDEVMSKLPANSPLKTRRDVLILASIVEKEAGNNEERPKVAAVFLNRLKKRMRLQADPTTAYAITKGEYKLMRPLKRSDLQIDSPYNTYRIYGLPAGPISCPGRASLEAVVNPANIKALYFVVNGKNGHHFSNTLEEHNVHVRNYRARSRSKKVKIAN